MRDGAMGDAGAVVTNDDTLAEHMTMLVCHGGLIKHQHHIEGINSRFDGIQAAILSAKLPHLLARTRRAEGLRGRPQPGRRRRAACGRVPQARLSPLCDPASAPRVQIAINYATALPFLAVYDRLKSRPEQFPNALRQQSRILSLPMFAEITQAQ
jgi:dTDP-4-amino-4,6-dideoxygalactose transaminase